MPWPFQPVFAPMACPSESPSSRPPLPTHARRALVDYYADDIRRLSVITGDDYTVWLGDQGAGEYSVRKSWAPSERVSRRIPPIERRRGAEASSVSRIA